MKLEPDKRVRIEVVASGCPLMKAGDTVYLSGPLIEYDKSAPMCISALVGLYPWIMTARFGIESRNLGHENGYRLCCPDKLVEFCVSHSPETA